MATKGRGEKGQHETIACRNLGKRMAKGGAMRRGKIEKVTSKGV